MNKLLIYLSASIKYNLNTFKPSGVTGIQFHITIVGEGLKRNPGASFRI